MEGDQPQQLGRHEVLNSCSSHPPLAGYSYDNPQAMLESLYARMSHGLDHQQLQQLLTDEIPIAIANVPCQTAYTAAYREAPNTRFDEFRTLFDTTLDGQDSASDS